MFAIWFRETDTNEETHVGFASDLSGLADLPVNSYGHYFGIPEHEHETLDKDTIKQALSDAFEKAREDYPPEVKKHLRALNRVKWD